MRILQICIILLITFCKLIKGQFELDFRPDDSYVVWCEVRPPLVEFRVTVGFRGWIGLGISRTPSMAQSDIFIGGISDDNNTPYYNDYHGIGNQFPVIDTSNDWTLIEEDSFQNETHTHLTFTRLLNTNDEDDIEIKDEIVYFIYAYGASDNLGGHGGARGYIDINLYSRGMSTATPPPSTSEAPPPSSTSESGDGDSFPYYDVSLSERTDLRELARLSGTYKYHLAFVLGNFAGCVPSWGFVYDIDEPMIIDPIRELQSQGAEFIIASGGALGPYLEHMCSTSQDLANAYIRALDAVGTNHLDVDIETSVNLNLMNQALAQVQRERPNTTVSFTLMVQGEDYGLTPALGVDLLVNAKQNGVRVDIVNAMAMEFPKISPDFGDAVINVGIKVLDQMREIWPELSEAQRKKMLGITPMIGRNFNGNVFEVAHATKLVNWANTNQIGLLGYWSIDRHRGGCEGQVSPICSGTGQQDFEFARVFQGFHRF